MKTNAINLLPSCSIELPVAFALSSHSHQHLSGMGLYRLHSQH